jgi:hypothetical protein
MNRFVPFLDSRATASRAVFVLLLSLQYFTCSTIKPSIVPDVLPVECKAAAKTFTLDWLDANTTPTEQAALKSTQTLAALNAAEGFPTLEAAFSGVGVTNIHQRLVQDIIQADPACHVDRLAARPAIPDSLLFPVVKAAVLEFLK